jgi:hypothetical protein
VSRVARAGFDLCFCDFCSGGAIPYSFDFAVYSDITMRCRPPDTPMSVTTRSNFAIPERAVVSRSVRRFLSEPSLSVFHTSSWNNLKLILNLFSSSSAFIRSAA